MQKGLLYNMLLRLGKCFFLFPLFFIACDDLEDKPSIVPESNGDVFETGTAEMYILSEGLFNQNNSSLARINGKTKCSVFTKHFVRNLALLTQNKMCILLQKK